MIQCLLLAAGGLFFSAFFSGSETGFYRVSRFRLVLDALEGDWISRSLVWLTNHPALFVATTLIGNNLANYATSMAIVLAIRLLAADQHGLAELIATVVLSPVVFVYGELLPKNLFYHAPNRLLRLGGPLLLLCAAAVAPISAVLWALGQGLQTLLGQTPLQVRFSLARKELQQVLEEGQEAGILRPIQRHLAQNLFAVAPRPLIEFSRPVTRVASVRRGAAKAEVLRMARRHRVNVVPVTEDRGRQLIGYVRVVDLYLESSTTLGPIRPLEELAMDACHIEAVLRLQSARAAVGRVVNGRGETVALAFLDDLTEPVLRGS